MSEIGLGELMTVEEAIRVIDAVPCSAIDSSAIHRAAPGVLDVDVRSDRDYPPFDKALMDGYAVRSANVSQPGNELRIVGEVAAGGSGDIAIQAQEILRIRANMNRLYSQYTGKDIETIEKAMERDNFMTADEAKDFGLVDAVFDKRPAAAEDAAG